MTDDQQFWLAMATLIVPTIASIMGVRQTQQTHKAVNGLLVRHEKDAHTAAVAEGRLIEKESGG